MTQIHIYQNFHTKSIDNKTVNGQIEQIKLKGDVLCKCWNMIWSHTLNCRWTLFLSIKIMRFTIFRWFYKNFVRPSGPRRLEKIMLKFNHRIWIWLLRKSCGNFISNMNLSMNFLTMQFRNRFFFKHLTIPKISMNN